jgi:hypothetical protein
MASAEPMKILEVISPRWSFKEQVSRVICRFARAHALPRSGRGHRPPRRRYTRIQKSCIPQALLWRSPYWPFLSHEDKDKLDSIHASACRIVLRIAPSARSSDAIAACGFWPLVVEFKLIMNASEFHRKAYKEAFNPLLNPSLQPINEVLTHSTDVPWSHAPLSNLTILMPDPLLHLQTRSENPLADNCLRAFLFSVCYCDFSLPS